MEIHIEAKDKENTKTIDVMVGKEVVFRGNTKILTDPNSAAQIFLDALEAAIAAEEKKQ